MIVCPPLPCLLPGKIAYRIALNFVGLNFCGYDDFHENYSTKIFNAHERAPIPGRNREIYSTKTLSSAIREI